MSFEIRIFRSKVWNISKENADVPDDSIQKVPIFAPEPCLPIDVVNVSLVEYLKILHINSESIRICKGCEF